MLNIMDNTTVKEVVRHLVETGVSDNEVQEPYHFTIRWLTHMARPSPSHPKESSIASEVLNRLRQSPNS
jgi:hypothetical protein